MIDTQSNDVLTPEELSELVKLDMQIMLLKEEVEDLQKERRTILMRGYQRNNRRRKQKGVDTDMMTH